MKIFFFWGMGVGGWGLGDWGWAPTPNPQSPIPNPQSPFQFKLRNFILVIKLLIKFEIKKFNIPLKKHGLSLSKKRKI